MKKVTSLKLKQRKNKFSIFLIPNKALTNIHTYDKIKMYKKSQKISDFKEFI